MSTVITRRSLQLRTFQSSVEEKCRGEHASAQLFFLLAEGSRSYSAIGNTLKDGELPAKVGVDRPLRELLPTTQTFAEDGVSCRRQSNARTEES